jgi:membrane associated rhomboid family serine protease
MPMIPIGTDAPIYHWPFATVGLIATNIVTSVLFWGMDPEQAQEWTLLYGEGLHPLQWLTFNFLHAGFFHLAGNMIFLWTFGLIVEGKVGPLAFLAIYLGLGVAEGAVVQTLMLGVEPGHSALGASGAICGLIGIALVWAPRNEISVIIIYFFGFMLRVLQFEWPVIGFALLYLAWQVFSGLLGLAMVGQFLFISELLHLAGAVLGFLLGTAMVKLDWVDCEGWDLYTRGIAGRSYSGKAAKKSASAGVKKSRKARAPADVEARSAEALGNLRAAIEDGAALDALAAYQDLARMPKGWRPLEPDLLKLIALLQRSGLTAESVPIMGDYIERFPEKAARVRLKLAQVLIRDQQRPAAALKVLAPIQDADLPEDLRPTRRAIEQQARRLVEEGVLEVEGEAW